MLRPRQKHLWPFLVLLLRVTWLLFSILSSGSSSKDVHEKLWDTLSSPQQTIHSRYATRRRSLFEAALNHHYASNSHIAATYLYTPSLTNSLFEAFPPFPPSRTIHNLKLLKRMFQHSYDSYMIYAWPAAEVKPISCQGGRFDLVPLAGLTLIDSLDTLVLLGNYTEFARSVERLRKYETDEGFFNVNENVSLFETTIRVLGGLLSAHQMAEAFLSEQVRHADVFDADQQILWGYSANQEATSVGTCSAAINGEQEIIDMSLQECQVVAQKARNATKVKYWKYDGFLLELANDLGNRLYPAFDTKTGIPYGTVNLIHGVPRGETTVASLAGAGTLSLEFELLSRLTGDEKFGKAAKLASRALWMRRSKTHDLNLFGKHIDIQKGVWTETLSGVGSNSDSFIEYLAKHYFLFPEDEDFWVLFLVAYSGVFENSRMGEWYVDTDMNVGARAGRSKHVLESLMAFYPGMQILLGELTPAARSLNSFFMVRELLGFLPERFNFGTWQVDSGRGHAGIHPLRPELLESNYFLHRATQGIRSHGNFSSSGWQWASDYSIHKIEEVSRHECGYAGLGNVHPQTTGSLDGSVNSSLISFIDEMPSFFLSETIKYLYLTFDEYNILHVDDEHQWTFTTEAHPIHSPPKVPKSNRVEEIAAIKNLLLSKIRGTEPSAPAWRKNYLGHEKWSDQTSHVAFHTDSFQCRGNMVGIRSGEQPGGFFRERQLEGSFVNRVNLDAFNDTLPGKNIVHTAMKNTGTGTGNVLRKSCPNFYESSLLWLHALTGGSQDYTSSYIPITSDELNSHSFHFVAIGAADALGIHGAGLHPVRVKDNATCPLHLQNEAKAQHSDSSGSQHTEGGGQSAIDVADFRVTAFSDGGGFVIDRISTDDKVIATFLFDETDASKVYAMIYAGYSIGNSINSHDTTKRSDASVWPVVGRQRPSDGDGPSSLYRRDVVIADLEGNSFLCEISLYDDTTESERLLATIPCAPGLFGSTDIRQLRGTEGFVVDGVLSLPPENDETGCSELESDSLTQPEEDGVYDNVHSDEGDTIQESEVPQDDGVVQVVLRGDCAFYSKALLMKARSGAKAVIVINTEEDELFTMAGTDPENQQFATDQQELPASVLVTGLDGKAILSIINTEASGGRAVKARISVTKQHTQLELGVKATGSIVSDRWPIVKGDGKSLHIFAGGGWGVKAIYDDKKGRPEWQLQLVQFEEKHFDLAF